MGSKSNYLENAVLNYVLGKTAFTPADPLYVGLWLDSNTLTDASDGNTAGEVSGGGYSRVSIDNDTVTWGSATTDGTRKNAIAITFPSASGSWGTVNQVAILDDATGGNIYFYGTLSTSKTVSSGDTVKFDINDVVVIED